MAEVSLSADEKKWKAESDARSLAEAEVIKKDKNRFTAAQEAAKELAKESKKEAESMADVASILFGDMLKKEDSENG